MNNNLISFDQKVAAFAQLVQEDSIKQLKLDHLDCEANIIATKTSTKPGKKYIKVDAHHSGRFIVEISTGNIFGIKAYGVIHRGHPYGTLDTTHEYYWGHYYPQKIKAIVIDEPAKV